MFNIDQTIAVRDMRVLILLQYVDILGQRFTRAVAQGRGNWDWAGIGELAREDAGLN